MKKISSILSSFLIALIMSTSLNADPEPSCSSGEPEWHVTYEASLSVPPSIKITCSSGGSMCCPILKMIDSIINPD